MVLLFLMSSVWTQKGLTGHCFKYTDRLFCLQADDVTFLHLLFADTVSILGLVHAYYVARLFGRDCEENRDVLYH